ncbi:uncharacterized protein P884DRAFT_265010 [Thermothelomyces heterothallicus CBS 202.75]|uniref:uncharacterized protein n=1 Tax=Thermothelomyces heterothallicus CBS 202.75 TaxID=1149848 RepID=UPI003741E8F9
MRFLVFTILLALSSFVRAVEFISPPPSSGTTNLGANPVYTVGSAIQVAWTDTGDTGIPFSVVVYQADCSDGVTIPADQAFEYVVHNAVNLTSTNWVVGTAKNLTFSNVFVLSVFFKGDTVGRALSHWFNMTKASDESRQPTPSTSLHTTASATYTSGISSVASTGTSTTSTASFNTASSTPIEENGGGFGTAAKIGVAVGGAGILVLGAIVGWLVFRWNGRRHEKRSDAAVKTSYIGPHYYAGAELSGEAAVQEKTPPRELDGQAPRYELYGDMYRYDRKSAS